MSALLKALIPTHAALLDAMQPDALNDLQERIVRWQRKNFPDQQLAGKLEHLRGEVVELIQTPHDRSEWADIFILVNGAAHMAGIAAPELIALAHAKMDINEKRKWGPADDQGVHHHIE